MHFTRILAGAALVAATSQMAQADIGGHVSWSFGSNLVDASSSGNYGDPDGYSSMRGEAVIGGEFNARNRWQIDLTGATGTYFSGDDYSTESAVVAHVSTEVDEWWLGGFWGMGSGLNAFANDTAEMNWGGLEIARDFGDVLFAAQLGLVSADNSNFEISFADASFWAVQLRYLASDDFMITGNFSGASATIDGNPYKQTVVGVEAMYRLGGSDFFGTLGARRSYMMFEKFLTNEGGESQVSLGATFLSGGGDLSHSYGADTPMISRQDLTWMGVNTSVFN